MGEGENGVCVCVGGEMGESVVHMCVCMCVEGGEGETERERVRVCVCAIIMLLYLAIAAYSSYPCHVQVVNLHNIAVIVDLHFNLRYYHHFAINI